MKTQRPISRLASTTLLCAVLLVAPVYAQVIVAPSSASTPPLEAGSLTSTDTAQKPASNMASALSSGLPLIQRGPIGVRPHFVYQVLYGDGIEAGPGNQRDSYIQSVSPGLLFDIGKYWKLDYTPTWTFYSNSAFRDTAGQAATLSGRMPHPHGIFGVAQSYESSYAMLVETGRQTHQTTYASLIEGTYKLGEHTTLEANVSRSARYANAVTDAPEWTTSDWVQWSSTDWLRYEVSPRFELSAGLGLGYADIGVGADMSFILPQAKAAWKPFDKITFTAQAGEENRKFENTTHQRLKSPVYSASASYQLLPTTKFSFEASRAVSASYFANEITKSKGWSIGLEQRFIQRLYLAASLSGQTTQYLATRATAIVERDDNYRAVNARLTTVVLHRASLALLYQTGRNTSDESAYVFRSDQYGIEMSVQF